MGVFGGRGRLRRIRRRSGRRGRGPGRVFLSLILNRRNLAHGALSPCSFIVQYKIVIGLSILKDLKLLYVYRISKFFSKTNQ